MFALIYSQSIQNIGLPFIQNYLPKDYGNHGKIWEIKAADNGMVYMAAENGVLEFDGQNWNRFRNYKGYTRSLHIANASTIYVGADMDFGVYKKDKFQKFSYTSLYPYRKNNNGVTEEFWGAYQVKDKIVFISHQNLYTLYRGKVSKISAPVRFTDSFLVNGLLYLADDRKGLLQFDGKNLNLICSYPENSQLEIAGVFKIAKELRIVTKNHAIFQVSEKKMTPAISEVNSILEKNKVFSFTSIDDKYLAFGTITDGLYITDLNGKIVQHINKNKGLPNNTVLSLFYQKNGKLWLGLDYGIASVDISSSISYFYSVNGDFGTGYTALINESKLFLGSNQGLYYTDWNNFRNNQKNPLFNLIKGSDGQVWTLETIEGNMYCGHDRGLFLVKDNVFQKINDEYGVSQIIPFRNNYVLTGNYKGISIYKKEFGRLRFVKNMKYILGAVSQIQIESNQTIWINIPNYGVIRTDLDVNLNPVNRKIFLDSEFEGNSPQIYKNDGEIMIVTATHAYKYISADKKFRLMNDKIGAAVIKEVLPGFYFPKKISPEYNFYPVYNGFALEKTPNQKVNFLADLVFRKAKAFNNHNETAIHHQQSISYKYNNFHFSFIAPNEEGVEYQYYLKGFSDKWSPWSTKNDVNFLNLKEGDYTLHIKARKENFFSETKKINFTVKAPWYRTIYSYVLYGLIIIASFYFLRKHHQNRLKKQAFDFLQKQRESLREQSEKHREEILIAKQKQMETEQQNLREEIRRKTIELATKAKDDEDKNRILSIINCKIKEIEDTPNISKIRLGEIRRMLSQYLHTEDHTFEIQMDELHQEFFKSMKVRFPNLSIYELRLCAYLRIGLNSKEMADIFQVLPSSINVSRSRLRKKLGLKPEDDLYNFLNGF